MEKPMTKPWEETWTATDTGGNLRFSVLRREPLSSVRPDLDFKDEGAAKLAAQAPAMARLLVDVLHTGSVKSREDLRRVLRDAGWAP